MDSLLNRGDILYALEIFKNTIHPDKFWVGYGSALCLQGIRDATAYIDICCDTKTFMNLSSKVSDDPIKDNITLLTGTDDSFPFQIPNRMVFSVDRDDMSPIRIEVYTDSVEPPVTMIEGFKVVTPEHTRKVKYHMGRPKDLEDIKRIDKYLSK